MIHDVGRCVAAYRVAASTSAFGRDGLLLWISALDLRMSPTEVLKHARRARLGLVATGVPALRIDLPDRRRLAPAALVLTPAPVLRSPFLRFLPPAAFVTQSACSPRGSQAAWPVDFR
jgi:hypothetical protein